MVRTLLVGAVLVSAAGVAAAQPATAPYPGPPPPPQQPYAYPPPPPPAYFYPPPPPQALTAEDQELLASGPITDGQLIGGGLAAVFVGFGVGQAVEGRWSDTGWIYTVTEGAALGATIYGFSEQVSQCLGPETDCHSSRGVGLAVGGMLAFSVLRVAESIDAFVAPGRHNNRLRSLRQRLDLPPDPQIGRVMPYVAPTASGGTVGGLALTF